MVDDGSCNALDKPSSATSVVLEVRFAVLAVTVFPAFRDIRH